MVESTSTRWIAVIPARGGSKRIPHKNIVEFCGRPMIEWTIEAALSCGVFEDVVVSTDSDEIAAVARGAGASVPFLRAAFADDTTPVSVATLWTISEIEKRASVSCDVVVQLMPNCPLRRAVDIERIADSFVRRRVPAMLSCIQFRFQNPWWAFTKEGEHNTEPVARADGRTKRSQDLPTTYSPTGAVWIGQLERVRAANSFYCPGHVMEEVPWVAGVDIDDYEELEIARALGAAVLTSRSGSGD